MCTPKIFTNFIKKDTMSVNLGGGVETPFVRIPFLTRGLWMNETSNIVLLPQDDCVFVAKILFCPFLDAYYHALM